MPDGRLDAQEWAFILARTLRTDLLVPRIELVRQRKRFDDAQVRRAVGETFEVVRTAGRVRVTSEKTTVGSRNECSAFADARKYFPCDHVGIAAEIAAAGESVVRLAKLGRAKKARLSSSCDCPPLSARERSRRSVASGALSSSIRNEVSIALSDADPSSTRVRSPRRRSWRQRSDIECAEYSPPTGAPMQLVSPSTPRRRVEANVSARDGALRRHGREHGSPRRTRRGLPRTKRSARRSRHIVYSNPRATAHDTMGRRPAA